MIQLHNKLQDNVVLNLDLSVTVQRRVCGARLVPGRAVFSVIKVYFCRLLQAVASALRIPRCVLRRTSGNEFSSRRCLGRVHAQSDKSNSLQGSHNALSKLALR